MTGRAGSSGRSEPARIQRMRGGRPPSLEAVERRRWQLWIVAGIFLIAVSTVVVLIFAEAGLPELMPDSPGLRWSFLALSVAFLLYVADQERALRRLTRALVDQQILTTALETRISDLTTLSKVGRVVNSVLTMDEVLQVILDSAFELTNARNGSVMLRDDDDLRVAVSAGADAAPVGSTSDADQGLAGLAAREREPILVDGTVTEGQVPGVLRSQRRDRGSAIVAPLIVADEPLGVLSLERSRDAEPFSDLDLRSIGLFAEHAATAVANAQRFEHERHTAARLADVIEMRSEFVATMVHDLKSPLTAIIGFSNMLRRRWERLDGDKRGSAIEHIEEQAKRLLSMVDEVLRSSSIEAGAELRREPIDLGDMLSQLADTVSAAAQGQEGVARKIDVGGAERPTVVYGDDEALRHVFSNLLENAVKYSPAASTIEVELERVAGEVKVRIRDQGEGISAEELPYVFERFRQSGGGGGGVGLGLYIVRTLVSAHGGEVSVDSEPGVGTTFEVVLPVRSDGGTVDITDDQARSTVPGR